MMNFKCFLLPILLLVSTVAMADMRDSYHTTTDAQKIGWMEKGMAAIKNKLKDPESAKFEQVYFHQGANNIPMTCGRVNAKNSFGGYSGFERFISAGNSNLSFLESEISDFNAIWYQMCQ